MTCNQLRLSGLIQYMTPSGRVNGFHFSSSETSCSLDDGLVCNHREINKSRTQNPEVAHVRLVWRKSHDDQDVKGGREGKGGLRDYSMKRFFLRKIPVSALTES